jgi:hypothetical protein
VTRACLSVFSFLAAVLLVGAALADRASEARFFDEAGRRAYQAGKYERALESFQLADEIAPSPRLLYNSALCADLAGRPETAFYLYEEYLRSDDADAARRKEAEGRASRLRGQLALVEVTSEPPGASVFVDRKELGRFGVTPVTVAVTEGERRLLLEHPGFLGATVAVAARRGTVVTANAALSPLFGNVSIVVAPATAALRFVRDGAVVPATSHGDTYRLPIGHYRLVASAPGYVSSEALLTISDEGEARVDLVLVPLPRHTGRLLVSAGKGEADVYLDGKRVAVTPATLPEVGVGTHTVEVRAGKRAASRTVTVSKGRATHVDLDPGTATGD